MKVLILLGLMTSTSLFAQNKSCRDAVIDAKARLGDTLATDSFSSRNFESYNITATEFNEMNSVEQSQIYMQIKPLAVMVDEVIATSGLSNLEDGTQIEVIEEQTLEF